METSLGKEQRAPRRADGAGDATLHTFGIRFDIYFTFGIYSSLLPKYGYLLGEKINVRLAEQAGQVPPLFKHLIGQTLLSLEKYF